MQTDKLPNRDTRCIKSEKANETVNGLEVDVRTTCKILLTLIFKKIERYQ